MATPQLTSLCKELSSTLRRLKPRVEFLPEPTWQETRKHVGNNLGALLTAPSKRAAKSGKFRNSDRINGVKPASAPTYAFKNAGIRNDHWQWME